MFLTADRFASLAAVADAFGDRRRGAASPVGVRTSRSSTATKDNHNSRTTARNGRTPRPLLPLSPSLTGRRSGAAANSSVGVCRRPSPWPSPRAHGERGRFLAAEGREVKSATGVGRPAARVGEAVRVGGIIEPLQSPATSPVAASRGARRGRCAPSARRACLPRRCGHRRGRRCGRPSGWSKDGAPRRWWSAPASPHRAHAGPRPRSRHQARSSPRRAAGSAPPATAPGRWRAAGAARPTASPRARRCGSRNPPAARG